MSTQQPEQQVPTALQYKEQGNQQFKLTQYNAAIELYTHGVDIIINSENNDTKLLIDLYNNRCACYLAQQQYQQCVSDANMSLQLQPNNNPKAVYRRQQAYEGLEIRPATEQNNADNALKPYDNTQIHKLLPAIKAIVISYLPYDYQIQFVEKSKDRSEPNSIANRIINSVLHAFNNATLHVPIQLHAARSCRAGCTEFHKYMYCNAIDQYEVKNVDITVCTQCQLSIFWMTRYDIFTYKYRIPSQQPATVQPNDIWFNVPLTSDKKLADDTKRCSQASLHAVCSLKRDDKELYINITRKQIAGLYFTVHDIAININMLTWCQQFKDMVNYPFVDYIMYYNPVTRKSDTHTVLAEWRQDATLLNMCLVVTRCIYGADQVAAFPSQQELEEYAIYAFLFNSYHTLPLTYNTRKHNRWNEWIELLKYCYSNIQYILPNKMHAAIVVFGIFKTLLVCPKVEDRAEFMAGVQQFATRVANGQDPIKNVIYWVKTSHL